MTDDSVLCRFDVGVYYFARTNILSGKSVLSSETVAIHKYINRRGERVGFYSGFTLANRMGLTSQVPLTEEITSNYAPATMRELNIKNRKYIIRRPIVPITQDNAYALQLLECLKDIDKCAEEALIDRGNSRDLDRDCIGELLDTLLSKDVQASITVPPICSSFGVSDAQLRFVSNSSSGTGLLKCGSVEIPFDNQLSKDSELYQLYNTNIHEKIAEEKIKEKTGV